MKRKHVIILIVAVLALAVYLNRAYARIFDYVDGAALANPNQWHYVVPSPLPSSTAVSYAAIGDSLTAGVGCDDYTATYPYMMGVYAVNGSSGGYSLEINNLAVPGARSGDLVSQLEQAEALAPDYVSLLIGTNDVLGNVPISDFQENLFQAVARLKVNTGAGIFLIRLPDIGRGRLMLPPYKWYYSWRTAQFNEAIEGICQDQGISCLDLGKVVDMGQKVFYSRDNFHPSCRGYQQWAQELYAGIGN